MRGTARRSCRMCVLQSIPATVPPLVHVCVCIFVLRQSVRSFAFSRTANIRNSLAVVGLFLFFTRCAIQRIARPICFHPRLYCLLLFMLSFTRALVPAGPCVASYAVDSKSRLLAHQESVGCATSVRQPRCSRGDARIRPGSLPPGLDTLGTTLLGPTVRRLHSTC